MILNKSGSSIFVGTVLISTNCITNAIIISTCIILCDLSFDVMIVLEDIITLDHIFNHYTEASMKQVSIMVTLFIIRI